MYKQLIKMESNGIDLNWEDLLYDAFELWHLSRRLPPKNTYSMKTLKEQGEKELEKLRNLIKNYDEFKTFLDKVTENINDLASKYTKPEESQMVIVGFAYFKPMAEIYALNEINKGIKMGKLKEIQRKLVENLRNYITSHTMYKFKRIENFRKKFPKIKEFIISGTGYYDKTNYEQALFLVAWGEILQPRILALNNENYKKEKILNVLNSYSLEDKIKQLIIENLLDEVSEKEIKEGHPLNLKILALRSEIVNELLKAYFKYYSRRTEFCMPLMEWDFLITTLFSKNIMGAATFYDKEKILRKVRFVSDVLKALGYEGIEIKLEKKGKENFLYT